jgi:hypothetical protein
MKGQSAAAAHAPIECEVFRCRPRADRVRGVPNRHLCGEFTGVKPVRHQPATRRETHALHPAVDHPCDAEQQHRGAEAEEHVGAHRKQQARDHEIARVDAVRPHAVHESGNSIQQPVQHEEGAEMRLGDAKVLLHPRHRETQILTDEIIRRVAEHRRDERAKLPVAEAFRRGGIGDGSGRRSR